MNSALSTQAKRAANWMLVEALLSEVGALFHRQGIVAMPIKGALLAPLLYSDPLERPMSDVDLVVAPGHFERADRALQEAGYLKRRGFLSIAHTYDTPQHLVLDLHGRFFVSGRYALRENEVFARAQPSNFATLDKFVIPTWLDVYAYSLGKFVTDHGNAASTSLVEISLIAQRVARQHAAPEVAVFLANQGLRRAARYALALCAEVNLDSFASDILNAMPKDKFGDRLIRFLRTREYLDRTSGWQAGLSAHLLNHSLPRAAFSALRAGPRHVMRRWDRSDK